MLVNPVQSFHPNAPPPSDAILLTSDARRTEEGSERYREWLRRLRAVCREAGVPLIFDEVYTGFRLAPGGAQEYFGVTADMVVYGKTVAGGMPIGVVCGTKALMRRFDPERPMRLAYVIGTFSGHPVVMGAMNEFLRWLAEPSTAGEYAAMNERCAGWVRSTNRRLAEDALPLRLVHLGSVWTVLFTEPGRYNWLLQYYLRAEGVALSWVGTGRCLANMDFTEKDYEDLQTKLLAAARAMKADGWWPTAVEHPGRETHMRRMLAREVLGSLIRMPRPVQTFYTEVMRRKKDDHHASHSDLTNQLFHIISSSVFLGCYALAFWDLTTAMWAGLAALFLRQMGHAILEPPCHDKEALLLGFNTRNKTADPGRLPGDPAVPPPAGAGLDRRDARPADDDGRAAVVPLDPRGGRRARALPHVGPQRVARPGVGREAGDRSAHRPRGLLAALPAAVVAWPGYRTFTGRSSRCNRPRLVSPTT